MSSIEYKAATGSKDGLHWALWIEMGLHSYGTNPEEAMAGLDEVMCLFMEECTTMGVLRDVLEESGYQYDRSTDTWMHNEPTQDKASNSNTSRVVAIDCPDFAEYLVASGAVPVRRRGDHLVLRTPGDPWWLRSGLARCPCPRMRTIDGGAIGWSACASYGLVSHSFAGERA